MSKLLFFLFPELPICILLIFLFLPLVPLLLLLPERLDGVQLRRRFPCLSVRPSFSPLQSSAALHSALHEDSGGSHRLTNNAQAWARNQANIVHGESCEGVSRSLLDILSFPK